MRNGKRIVIIGSKAFCPVIRHEKSRRGGSAGNCFDYILAELLRAIGAISCGRDNGTKQSFKRRRFGNLQHGIAKNAESGCIILVRVNDKIHLRPQLIRICVDPFFTGGLYASFVGAVLDIGNHDLIRCQILVCAAAGGNHELRVADSCTDISPGPCDQSGFQQFQSCPDNELSGFL